MKSVRTVTLTIALFAALFGMQANAQETWRARLSPLPVTPQTVTEITGEGEVILVLDGNTLTVTGEFSGMSSNATAAHLHNGPPAQPGPATATLEIEQARAGQIRASLTLGDEQLAALRNNELYVQVHSVNNGAGELRGWIFRRSHFDNL